MSREALRDLGRLPQPSTLPEASGSHLGVAGGLLVACEVSGCLPNFWKAPAFWETAGRPWQVGNPVGATGGQFRPTEASRVPEDEDKPCGWRRKSSAGCSALLAIPRGFSRPSSLGALLVMSIHRTIENCLSTLTITSSSRVRGSITEVPTNTLAQAQISS